MKNLNIIVSSLIILLSIINNASSQNNGSAGSRKLFWVHGLAGDIGTWTIYRDHYQNQFIGNNIECYNPSGYSEQENLDVAGTAVNVMMKNLTEFDPIDTVKRNIAIGHSQGGLVIRNADMRPLPSTQRQFGGFITVGTPNKGAKIINSIEGNLLKIYTYTMCQNLKPMYTDCKGLAARALFSFIVPDTICNTFSTLVEKAFGSFQKGITQDYKIGGPGVLALEAYNSTLPHVGIYGAETTPVNWRVISSIAFNTPSSLPFNTTNDTAALKWASDTRADFFAKKLSFQTHRDNRDSWWVKLTPVGWVAFCINSAVSNGYANASDCLMKSNNAINWLDNSEEMWKGITTDYTLEKVIEWDWELVKMDDPYDGRTWDEWQYLPHEVNVTTWDETDAIVGKRQADLKGAIKMFKSAGANHQEVRNHPSSTIIFNNLFEGNSQLILENPEIKFFKL